MVGAGPLHRVQGQRAQSRNLDSDGRCVLGTEADGAHLVVEGKASRVRDRATLERASAAFQQIYGWPTTVAGDPLDADYSAPTSGGPPYRAYQIAPTKILHCPSTAASCPPGCASPDNAPT
jgi:hypothetical protein